MKYSKILSILGISCVAGLLFVFGVKLQAQDKTKEASFATNEMDAQAMQRAGRSRNRQQGANWGTQGRQQGSRSGEQERSESSGSKDKPDFYRVIVDNNIFRPLGWRPPNKEPEYTFVGTRVDSSGTVAEAYVLERRSNQFFMASIGDKIGDAVVTDIKQKEILLSKNGEVITLKAGNMQFLQGGGSRRGGSSRGDTNNRDENSDNRNASSSKSSDKDAAAKAKAAAEQNAKRQAMERGRDMRSRFENASPGERERMMREYRGRGRGRGDR